MEIQQKFLKYCENCQFIRPTAHVGIEITADHSRYLSEGITVSCEHINTCRNVTKMMGKDITDAMTQHIK